MGRLQRDHGGHIVGLRTFSQVLTRHGAFMGSVALVLTLVMGAPALVQSLACCSTNQVVMCWLLAWWLLVL